MDKKTALELYALFRQENALWLQNHREHSQQYFTLIIAILAASITGVSQIQEPPFLIVMMYGPLFNLFLCRIGITLCNRSYQAYLEGLSVQAKLEPIIGLTEPRTLPEATEPLPQFSKDEYYLPERWLKSRHFATAERFVEEGKKKGANRIIQETFGILSFINISVVLGILANIILLYLETCPDLVCS
jgi:hypothetical protein